MILIWTDNDGAVQRSHYKPSMLSDEEKSDSIEVDEIPEYPTDDPPQGERYHLFYTETDGFDHHTVSE